MGAALELVKTVFATGIQTNAILISFTLVSIQFYILAELNGHLYDILLKGCLDPMVIGTIFAPTLALVFMGKAFSSTTSNRAPD